MNTPWGKSQNTETIMTSMYNVYTAGHGGMMIGKKFAESFLSAKALENGEQWGNFYCFEEDCAYALPYFELLTKEFPNMPALSHNFKKYCERTYKNVDIEELIEQCKQTIGYYYPTYFN